MAQSLKLKVNSLLTKLGDRDTFSIAAAELESISRTLDATTLPIFLSCILSINSSDKSGVRKQCLKLISLLAGSYSQLISPFVPKIISHLLRRLRDPDSAVRVACVDSVSALASNVTKCSFASFLKPLCDAVCTEQEQNAQIGAALCLAAAIDASPDPDPARLGRILPKLEKLVKCDGFKAKAAGLTVVGSVIASGGVSNLAPGGTKELVDCLVGFLIGEDWAARKAAAGALWKLALVERDSMAEYKTGCLKVFEAKRFDKVKAVREVMNQMVEAWKQIPDVSEESSPPPSSQASSKEDARDGRNPRGSKVSSTTPGLGLTQFKKKSGSVSRSTPPDNNSLASPARKRSPLKSSEKKTSPATFQKVNRKKDWKVEIDAPSASSLTRSRDDDIKERYNNARRDENGGSSKTEVKRALFSKNSDDKMNRFGRLKSVSRVAPCHEETSEATVLSHNTNENLHANHRGCEDLSLIRSQLIQIEKQQSGLVDLLQRFMGSSQSGMQSLETRVHGLELALDEISYDLAVTSGRLSNSRRSACWLLPSAGFWSPKFWRRNDATLSTSNCAPLSAATRYRPNRNHIAENFQPENQRLRFQGRGGFIMNPLADIHSNSRGDV